MGQMGDKQMDEHVWVAYDERAIITGDTDDAAVMVAIGTPDVRTNEEAIKEITETFKGQWMAIYRYDVDGKNLVNEVEVYVGNGEQL